MIIDIDKPLAEDAKLYFVMCPNCRTEFDVGEENPKGKGFTCPECGKGFKG